MDGAFFQVERPAGIEQCTIPARTLGEKSMRHCKRVVFLILLVGVLCPFASSQLRNFSEYNQDRINREQTGFVLYDTGKADYVWTSEWTHMTAYAADGKSAILVWHFKDGTKAYSQQGEGIGEFGKTTGYLIKNTSHELEDIDRNKIQPLTRDNYPVKIELWIGEIGDATGYGPEFKGDEACFQAAAIDYDISYSFSECGEEE
jgi:hypothetical protein